MEGEREGKDRRRRGREWGRYRRNEMENEGRKGKKGGERERNGRPTDRPRKGGRKGNAPTGEMGNFQHTLCQNDIAAAADRRDGGHGRKWDGFYLPSIRRSITPLRLSV